MDAHEVNNAKIAGHPMFPSLVREVAIAEQPSGPGLGWLRRNSRTYGTWMTRGMGWSRPFGWSRRAYLIAGLIVDDLGVMPDSPQGDRVASAYVHARDYVHARLSGRTP